MLLLFLFLFLPPGIYREYLHAPNLNNPLQERWRPSVDTVAIIIIINVHSSVPRHSQLYTACAFTSSSASWRLLLPATSIPPHNTPGLPIQAIVHLVQHTGSCSATHNSLVSSMNSVIGCHFVSIFIRKNHIVTAKDVTDLLASLDLPIISIR